ncbi:MAG: 3-hydroxyacyl-CoA dehydrogenase/enoyl-CoA hydratase family protein [Bacteroidia bacterium]|nr:3-hydroxyacyl-CoA dehydrogenase/enoyl-CoA hydratase family protein [Bacteroidia bacterium]
MTRNIRKVAVLGSGVMGSQIACHFANTGVEVLLLDIPAPGSAPDNLSARNKIVNEALANALKMSPSPIYRNAFAGRIQTGNLEDDFARISNCDWIIEVVVERLDIKKQVFEKVEAHRRPGSLVTSNTSGIPIQLMTEGRSDDFRKNFCGTHFFNPPRYLRLLEIIPTSFTDKEVISFLMEYGELHLGKTTVLCKDTPAFIANRVGVYSIMSLFHTVEQMGLTIEEVDKLTGPVLGRPKSATFRTCDVVGLDTLVHVANGLEKNLPDDEARALFTLPGFIRKMTENNMLGAKTGKGFYYKPKGASKDEIQVLDLSKGGYRARQKVKFATLEAAKPVEDLRQRMKILISGKDKAGDFYRPSFAGLFSYVSHRIPEIADEIYKIDDAMRSGFGWELGPFECWDVFGVKETVEMMKANNVKVAPWIDSMLAGGNSSFYRLHNGRKEFYDPSVKTYQPIPGTEDFLFLDILRGEKTVWKNAGVTLTDTGDGILNLEFHTKMNSIGGEIIQGINTAIEKAEKEFSGLVISNEGQNFSAGANVGMIFMFAVEQEWDELNLAIRMFQNTMMRIRYSSVPVVVAPHNLALGGACEMSMHSDRVVAHAECYMGLVEFGVGLIPGGGGTKEFALRLSDEIRDGDVELNAFRNRFLTIGQARVGTSAYEAFDLGYLRNGNDLVVVSRQRLLTEAKKQCKMLADAGYTQPQPRKDIRVLGKQGLGLAYLGANSMLHGHYISEHDVKISQKLAWVLCGGDLSAPTKVSEQYLLDLEREAFLSLCGERKTLERIQSILTGGKVLRN